MPSQNNTEVYRGPFFSVDDETLVDPEGVQIRRVTVRHPGGAAVLPVDEKGRILLVRQYRHAVLDSLWELPAGRIDKGEKPLQTAKREFAEETGYRAAHWKKLGMIYPSPGMLDERLHLYLATGLREAGKLAQHHDEDERVTLRWFTSKELDAMIANGKLPDGKTICGYLIWKRFAKKGIRA
jgi:8-oxo-dGTP pyrophosphatase MutT (NUDIX family)